MDPFGSTVLKASLGGIPERLKCPFCGGLLGYKKLARHLKKKHSCVALGTFEKITGFVYLAMVDENITDISSVAN